MLTEEERCGLAGRGPAHRPEPGRRRLGVRLRVADLEPGHPLRRAPIRPGPRPAPDLLPLRPSPAVARRTCRAWCSGSTAAAPARAPPDRRGALEEELPLLWRRGAVLQLPARWVPVRDEAGRCPATLSRSRSGAAALYVAGWPKTRSCGGWPRRGALGGLRRNTCSNARWAALAGHRGPAHRAAGGRWRHLSEAGPPAQARSAPDYACDILKRRLSFGASSRPEREQPSLRPLRPICC